MGTSVLITGDDVVAYHGNSISTPPRDWYGTAGSMVDRIAAANPGPRGGPYFAGSDAGAGKVIVTGSAGFQRGSQKAPMPPWFRLSASGQDIEAMTPEGIIPYNPDVIFHETQANDLINFLPLSNYETAMRHYIDTLTTWKPSVRVVWINVWSLQENYDLGPLRWHPATDTFRAIDAQVCSEKPNMVLADVSYFHLNLLPALYGPWPATGTPYTDDGVHPSEPTGKLKYCDGVMPVIVFKP